MKKHNLKNLIFKILRHYGSNALRLYVIANHSVIARRILRRLTVGNAEVTKAKVNVSECVVNDLLLWSKIQEGNIQNEPKQSWSALGKVQQIADGDFSHGQTALNDSQTPSTNGGRSSCWHIYVPYKCG